MSRAFFRDKVGGVESFDVQPGQLVKNVLRAKGIPVNSVLTTINGKVVSEDTAVIGQDDDVQFQQVRHYDLNVTRNPPQRNFGTYTNPIYTKAVIFDKNGQIEVRSEDFDESSYVSYVEQTFVESVKQRAIFEPNARAIVGLSGGRDSVAFLKLLERTQAQLPKFELTAVTVTGIPDWDEPGTFGAAKAACQSLGVRHIIVDGAAVTKAFRLNRPFVDVMTEVLAGETGSMVMVVTHHVMRRMIEVEAEKLGISTVLLGLNADDLMASLVTWFTTGFQMGGIPVREIGPFKYAFPLYRITKKELTLYLQLIAPELTRQGTPGRFTTGPGERSLAYAISDHLYGLWPGIDYYTFEAFANMQEYSTPKSEAVCQVCGACYLLQKGVDNPADMCDICSLFSRVSPAQVI